MADAVHLTESTRAKATGLQWRRRLLTLVCLVIGTMMLYRGIINLTQYPGNWERILLGPIFLGGVYGIYLMWREWRIGWWIFTALNFLVGYWFIFILEDIWQHHVMPHIIFSAVFLPFYPDMKKSAGIRLLANKITNSLAEFAVRLLTIEWVVALIEQVPSLRDWINRLIIHRIVSQARNRPHPYSTRSLYTSWTSLTDRTWSGRHLGISPIDQATLPKWEMLEPLFKRTSESQRLCPKSTCLFPSFAQYLTDGFIRTQNETNPDGSPNPDHRKRNTSNHEIDLCPLYGRTPEQTQALRVKSPSHAERGKLRSQFISGEEYAEFLFDGDEIKEDFKVLDRPLGLDKLNKAIESEPAEIAAAARTKRGMLFAFGGDRTNSVPQTSMINTLLLREHNRLATELGRRWPDWTDDQLFETARNIVIVEFIKIVVEDYINHIAPSVFKLRADPKAAWKAVWNRPNWITTEFSLLYRWHALIPDEIVWGAHKYRTDPAYFLNNKPLIDVGLACAFEDMSAQPTGELGPRNTTKELLGVEQASVAQGRECQLRSYNDYLQYLGRAPAKSMSEISSSPEVVKILAEAYGNDVNKVDFFVGIFCEDRVKNSPLPRTILSFVALDAFSQALTNPLLSEHVFTPPESGDVEHPTFTQYGWEQIVGCSSLRDLVIRNVAKPEQVGFVGMTLPGWVRE